MRREVYEDEPTLSMGDDRKEPSMDAAFRHILSWPERAVEEPEISPKFGTRVAFNGSSGRSSRGGITLKRRRLNRQAISRQNSPGAMRA
jgi:hypothetical protein